jgi:hypothetical protein
VNKWFDGKEHLIRQLSTLAMPKLVLILLAYFQASKENVSGRSILASKDLDGRSGKQPALRSLSPMVRNIALDSVFLSSSQGGWTPEEPHIDSGTRRLYWLGISRP